MSLLSAKRLTLTLAPRPPEEPQPWQGALEELGRKVGALRGRVELSVVLSNHFVRYALLPEQDGSATPEEELALARFQFAKIHGERAKAWEVRVSGELACAIDRELLEGVKSVFPPRGKARLVSVQPALMVAYNRARRRIPRAGAWLVVAEAGRTCLARLTPRGWGSVHNGRETDGEALIERERNRAVGEPLPSLVLREQL